VSGWSVILLAALLFGGFELSIGRSLLAQQPAAEPSEADAPGPPGDEVMRPTEHGLRLTPGIARGMAGIWIDQTLETELNLSISFEQRDKLQSQMARRMLEVGHSHDKSVSRFFEAMHARILEGRGKVKAEAAEGFADKALQALPAWRDFFGGLTDDLSSTLTPEQQEKLREFEDRMMNLADSAEQRMAEWKEEGIEGNENPFDHLEESPEEANKPEVKEERASMWRQRHAVRRARRDLEATGPAAWRRFLNDAQELLNYDADQMADATNLLMAYTEVANEIMTPEWRKKVTRNRYLYHARTQLEDREHLAPWLFHLDREYDELVNPLKKLGRTFRRDVIMLATDDQLELVRQELFALGRRHGMTSGELLLPALGGAPEPIGTLEEVTQDVAQQATEASPLPPSPDESPAGTSPAEGN
jgi:hypothetical protein